MKPAITRLRLHRPEPRSHRPPHAAAISVREGQEFSAKQWRKLFSTVGVQYEAPPFALPDEAIGLWLPRSEQLVLIADNLARPTLRLADRLDVEVGRHVRHAHIDDLAEDVRVVLAMSGFRFFGFKAGSFSVHASVAAYRCRVCRQWWFLLEWGSWACRCCGGYDGNAGVAEQFTDVIDVRRLPGRAAG